MTHEPCVAHCGRMQRVGRFLCPECWRSLPPGLRAGVSRTWDTFNTIDREKDRPAYLAALVNYRRAREAALRHLEHSPAMSPERARAESLFK